MVLAAWLALQLTSVLEGFQLLLKVGAGTGLIYILRWFWWRVNAWAEIVAMAVSFLLAAGLFVFKSPLPDWQQFLLIVGLTTLSWMLAVFLGPAESDETLRTFCARIRPGGPGWRRVIQRAHAEGQLLELDDRWNMPQQILFAVAAVRPFMAYCSRPVF